MNKPADLLHMSLMVIIGYPVLAIGYACQVVHSSFKLGIWLANRREDALVEARAIEDAEARKP